MIQYKKLMMTLALLLTAVTGAWADWTGGTYTATADENLGNIIVSDDVTLTINAGVTVTVTSYNVSAPGIKVANGKTLTIVGPGTLVVNGAAGNDGGNYGDDAGNAIMGAVVIYGGTITATGGKGGYGTISSGHGGAAFAGRDATLTYYGGTVNANGGDGGGSSSEMHGQAFASSVTVTWMSEPTSGRPSNFNQQYVSFSDYSDAIAVTWNASTKTGTFTMPDYNVVLTPIYAPAAQWAIESDVELLPKAAEGIIAGTTDAIIEEGTVTTGQGTVMYFATTDATMTAEQAAQANGWLSTVPTAEAYDDATTVYVWYYIAGADTPDGQEATDKNTFNDSEICATPIEVTLLSNEFDITLKAANANTIDATQASKGTVTVSGTDKTGDITEGKLQGVKMGQQVKMTAAQGYKFRKVEAKKGGAEVSITVGNVTLLVTGCTTWEQVIAKNSDKIKKSLSDDVETVDGFAFLRKGTDIVKITHTVDPNATDYNWYEM